MSIAQTEQQVNLYKMMTTRMSKGNVPLPNQTGVLWKKGQFTVKLGRFHNGLIMIFYVNENRIAISRTLANLVADYSKISAVGSKWVTNSESQRLYNKFEENTHIALSRVVQS